MAQPYISEPLHADINWSEEHNERNNQDFGIWFEDILSGFAKSHVRQAFEGTDQFIAMIEVGQTVFEVWCRTSLGLTILAADVASAHAQETYYKTLSQSP
jgi:hypothetical protein